MENTNRIIGELEKMRESDMIRGEKFSALAYAKAIKAFKALPADIQSVEDIKNIPGVGVKIQAKVKEILETGSLKAAKALPNLDIYMQLLKIHGVGPVAARKLVDTHGIKSIDELRQKQATLLNDVQRMGLKYYEDILERIPRSEMMRHEVVLKASIPKGATGTIVGSYRRGADTSGDIDMLITFDSNVPAKEQRASFQKYIQGLKESGYILDILAEGAKKCMAVVVLPTDFKARRLDLLITPSEEYAYSLLYFTGSDAFNVAFRKHALTHGYSLNEHKMSATSSSSPPSPIHRTEEEIFQFLGLKYVEPQARKDATNIVKLI